MKKISTYFDLYCQATSQFLPMAVKIVDFLWIDMYRSSATTDLPSPIASSILLVPDNFLYEIASASICLNFSHLFTITAEANRPIQIAHNTCGK